MGAFFIASMSMFVSCKDYDDDINANAKDIVELQNQLKKLQDEVDAQKTAAGNYATKDDLNSLAGQLASYATLQQLQDAQKSCEDLIAGKVDQAVFADSIKALSDKINAINPELNTLKTTVANLQSAIANAATQEWVLAQLAGLSTGNPADAAKVDSALAAVKAIEEGLNVDDVKALKEKMQQISNIVDQLASNGNVITNFVVRQLASLTFVPRLFVGGIETATVPRFQGKFFKTPKDLRYTGNETATDSIISGNGVAEYHVSPTTAKLVGSTLDFFSFGATTRAGENYITPTDYAKTLTQEKVDSLYDVATGILSVPFKADWTKIKALEQGKTPIAALQISVGDTTVTSDYAQFLATEFADLKLADIFDPKGNVTDCGLGVTTTKHLATLWADVAADDGSDYTHAVAFNGHLNLDSIVKSHATETVNDQQQEVALTDAELDALGLKYKYSLVPYTIGNNGTDESAHLEIIDGIAYPRNIKADGTTDKGKVANESAIGRTPVVLVELVDKATGKQVYAEGYIKIKISTVAEAQNAQVAPTLAMTNDLYSNCDDAKDSLTWNAVEYNIYNNLLSISKATFENNYTFDKDSVYVTTDEKHFTAIHNGQAETDSLGWVYEKVDPDDPTTNVLFWQFTAAQLNNLKDELAPDAKGNSTKPLKVYAYFKRNGETNIKSGVFVPLEFAAGKVHYAVGSIDGKVLGYWYDLNSASAGDEEVRVNVPVPTAEKLTLANTDFKKDLKQFFSDNTVAVAGLDTVKFSAYKNIEFELTTPAVAKKNATFNAAKDNTWTVTGVSGKTYTLKLKDANTIQVVKEGKKSITAVDLITLDGSVITYVEGEVQDDILNYVGHKDLGERETLTAYVQVKVGSECGDYATINNPYFNVRFLRPVNLSPAKGAEIKDAPNGGMDIALANLVTVTDWREYTCLPDADKNLKKDWATNSAVQQVAFSFYGIKIVTDTASIYTDIDKEESVRNAAPLTSSTEIEKLKKSTSFSGLKITQKDDATLHYENNEGNVQKFHLYVPVAVQYVFGQPSVQNTYAVITVTKTVQNAKRN